MLHVIVLNFTFHSYILIYYPTFLKLKLRKTRRITFFFHPHLILSPTEHWYNHSFGEKKQILFLWFLLLCNSGFVFLTFVLFWFGFFSSVAFICYKSSMKWCNSPQANSLARYSNATRILVLSAFHLDTNSALLLPIGNALGINSTTSDKVFSRNDNFGKFLK